MAFPPLVEPAAELSGTESARTARHRVLAGFGDIAQRRLAAAHVAIVGAGGLGSPSALALAAAGVGTLTVIDDDDVDLSNLQRQVIHRVGDVGAAKVDSAVRIAAELSPSTVVHPVRERLTPGNAARLLAGAHVVIDGSDTFDTREAVASGCEALGVPLVWGVVQEFHAQVTVFWSNPPAGAEAVLLSDLHPPEAAGDVPSCAQVGVLGSLCLQVGGMLATEAIKLITGVGDPGLGRVVVVDALRGRFDEVPLRPARAHPAFPASAPGARSPRAVAQLDAAATRAAQAGGATLIDVREPAETSRGVIPGSVEVPLATLLADPRLAGGGPVVVVCQVGMRAQRAARALVDAGIEASVLAGGIAAWDAPIRAHDRVSGSDLVAIDDHLATVLAAVTPLAGDSRPLAAARGRILREDARGESDIPVFDNSAMDGFAVRFEDVAAASEHSPVTLRVIADLPAGTDLDPPLAAGEAARIMTGSPTPTAATAIVPFEDTVGGLADSLGEIIVVRAPRAPGVHIRRRGEDLVAGDIILTAGVRLGALQTAALAAAGVAEAVVSRAPRVAVISTGSELVAPGTALRRGQIPESNSEMLTALAAEAGAEVVLSATVGDDGDGPRRAIAEAEALGADVVVFSGGVSAGAYEVVKSTLGDCMTFTKLRMQPGKPQGFGVTDAGTLLFGLPGNPVSSAVSFEVFVRPALLRMQGHTELHRPVIRLAAASGWRTPAGRTQYLPITIDRTDPAAWRAVPATSGGSHLPGGLGRAEAYAIVPAEVDEVGAGEFVDVMLIS